MYVHLRQHMIVLFYRSSPCIKNATDKLVVELHSSTPGNVIMLRGIVEIDLSEISDTITSNSVWKKIKNTSDRTVGEILLSLIWLSDPDPKKV